MASDVKFKFNHHGDGPARYNIMHYKQISKGNFEWVNVGEFHDENMELRMEGTHTHWVVSIIIPLKEDDSDFFDVLAFFHVPKQGMIQKWPKCLSFWDSQLASAAKSAYFSRIWSNQLQWLKGYLKRLNNLAISV